MEIRFSKPWPDPWGDVWQTAYNLGQVASFTSALGNRVRFMLPQSNVEAHDRVIRALLTLDPDAVVRTAKAIYDGREDFEAQVKARVG